ncbi:zinc finger BED domain-containing protein RICESLEEPER 3-like [Mangifera indica]|uniref:zinc finger BED domain-containing protein RICESLEEPER 3-like n=1 Tax=Mangifera indica TaxID=29780 RepID=UPI001CFB5CCA|nr:zinc finger BED domain-containing protein RICESLEEPER 3-like [Mangifera indica]
MEPISTGSDADGRIKCLLDLVEWYKNNFNPENGGILDETITYLQTLQRQEQELKCLLQPEGADLQRGQVIESLAPQGDAFESNPHVNEQEITQLREQNINFKPVPNQGINMGVNKKRKLRSDVWNDFIRYENEDKEIKARCQHCMKDFNGSSKSGTTHLRNHLRSCLKNQNRVTDKMKMLSVIDQELLGSNFVQKIIERLDNIEDDIFEIYTEEQKKLQRYLDKLPGRFNVIIEESVDFGVEVVIIWFIDDKWKLKTRIIHLRNYEETLNEDSLKCLIQDWNIDKRILSMDDYREDPSEDMVPQLTNWLNERVSLPVIGNYERHRHLLFDFESKVDNVARESDIMSELRKLRGYSMTSSNKDKFDLAVKQVESMGKKVTSKYGDVYFLFDFKLLDWAMGYKEVFCELKRTDPDFTSSNFDWDDATSLHSFWVVLEDIENDIKKLGDDSKLANECFPMVYRLFSKMLQFKNTDSQYFCLAALYCREIFDEYCNNSKLVIVITVILDPRFKRDIVEKFYNEVYDNEGDLHLKKIMDDVTNIYNEYARDVNNSSMVIAYANEAASSKSEFECYLTDSKVSPREDFDILEWWHCNSLTYPTLAMIARDFLSIPIVGGIHGVRFEDGFADIYNSDLADDYKDTLACTKVWLNDRDCM